MTRQSRRFSRWAGAWLSAAFSCAFATAPALGDASHGAVEGQLKIAPNAPAQLGDPVGALATPDYASFVLLVRSGGDGKQVVQVVTPDKEGKYRAALPPGRYVIELQQRRDAPPRTVPQPFLVSPNTTTRLDVAVAPDVRKAGPQNGLQ